MFGTDGTSSTANEGHAEAAIAQTSFALWVPQKSDPLIKRRIPEPIQNNGDAVSPRRLELWPGD
jgi:hypothetical protein